MNWKTKLIAQKLVGLIPGTLGERVHAKFQARHGRLGHFDEALRLEHVYRCIATVGYLSEKAGFTFSGSRIIEVGTGWHASDLTGFYLLGCEEYWACDQIPHLDWRHVSDMIASFAPCLDDLCEAGGADRNQVQQRYDRIAACANLDQYCRVANVIYRAPSVFHDIDFPPHHFDLFYSYSVLQRVPPGYLVKFLTNAHSALKRGGHALNVIHHSDHNARHQSSLGRLNYLRYSDFVYDLLQSKKYNYQNRMRHAEFIEMFENTGFKTMAEELTRESEESIRGIPLAKRFRAYPIDDLVITRTQLLSQAV